MAELKNIKALADFRLRGVKVVEGEVVAKKDFAQAGDWQNLVHMTPPRAEETEDNVGKPGKTKAMPKVEADK